MDRLLAMIKRVCDKPGLYIGHARMRSVRAFLDGYAMALGESGELPDYPFGGFLRWLEQRHNICHSAWGWDRILVHAAGSDAEAIRTLPALRGLLDRSGTVCDRTGMVGVGALLVLRRRKYAGSDTKGESPFSRKAGGFFLQVAGQWSNRIPFQCRLHRAYLLTVHRVPRLNVLEGASVAHLTPFTGRINEAETVA